jgi:hypothetical protein
MRRLLAVAVVGTAFAGWMLWPHQGIAHVTTTNTVVFEREIVRILEAHCAACHSGVGAAPRLVTYEDVWLERNRVLASVLEGSMPPWAAVRGYGDFANDNGLTPREKQFVVSWVEGLGPRNAGELFLNVGGAAVAGEPVRARVDPEGWQLGEPGGVYPLPPRALEPEAEGLIESLVIDLGLGSDRWVTGLELEPGDPGAVRAADVFVEGSGQWLGSWTPWYGFTALPDGVAYRLAPGARLRVEVVYGRGTTLQRPSDAGRLGLHFAEEGRTDLVAPSELVLEARREPTGRDPRVRLHAEAPINVETRVLSLLPQLDAGARSLEVSGRLPDGGTEILLFARELPGEWPTPYVLREPVALPPGSVLRATAYFDNPTEATSEVGFRVRVSRF